MANRKKSFSALGWWLVVVIIIVIAVLVYPSVSRITSKQIHQKTDKVVARYQKAITNCIQKNQNQLKNCSAGQHSIPKPYSSWFHAIRSIHVYRGVIQVRIKQNLGETTFIYYIPRAIQRRWFSSTTQPTRSVSWQRIESSYCGLSDKQYSCKNFMKH